MLSQDENPAETMTLDELAAALRWQLDMGVDLAVGDAPRNYFAEAAAKATLLAETPVVAPSPPAESASLPAGARPPRIAPPLAPELLPVRAASPQGPVSPEEALSEARALAAPAP